MQLFRKVSILLAITLGAASQACAGYALREAPGEPSFEALGSWNLEPASGDVAVLGEFYFTGALDIARASGGGLTLKLTLHGNGRAMGRGFQRVFTLDDPRSVATSATEIVAAGMLRLDRSREYNGSAARLDNWEESQMGPWTQTQTREECNQLSDVYCRRDVRLDLIAPDTLALDISRWSFAGAPMVFRRVVPPARAQDAGAVPRFAGAVFLIQAAQKTITITGNDVNARLRNGARIMVLNRGQVVAQGAVTQVFSTYARVQIASGIEALRPRMNAISP